MGALFLCAVAQGGGCAAPTSSSDDDDGGRATSSGGGQSSGPNNHDLQALAGTWLPDLSTVQVTEDNCQWQAGAPADAFALEVTGADTAVATVLDEAGQPALKIDMELRSNGLWRGDFATSVDYAPQACILEYRVSLTLEPRADGHLDVEEVVKIDASVIDGETAECPAVATQLGFGTWNELNYCWVTTSFTSRK